MAFIFRWLVRATTIIIVVTLLSVITVRYLALRSLPSYDAVVRVPAISAPVEIVRDNANVPHIFGANDADVFHALGFAHAQDRLWQMMMLRRTAQGRLSELFGKATLNTDIFLRRLDIYRLAVQSVNSLDLTTVTILEAYAAGVNARLDQINTEALGRGAPEMFLFNASLAPWQPADSLAIIKLMGLHLASQMDNEILRARMSLNLQDPERLLDILPNVPGPGVASLAKYTALVPGTTIQFSTSQQQNYISPFKSQDFAGASNAWAAATSRSASGGTLLANDPHMSLTAPSIWYLARLNLRTGDVIGGTIPGMPLVLTGRSDKLGWGLTSAYVDDQDLFIEEINRNNPLQYRTLNGFK
jgi:penicillin amidase